VHPQKSYQKTLSYTAIVPYSRVLSYIPIYSVLVKVTKSIEGGTKVLSCDPYR
jgi:hypothetical protein